MPFLTKLAQLGGATQQEIDEAILMANFVSRDAVPLDGMNFYVDNLAKQLHDIQDRGG